MFWFLLLAMVVVVAAVTLAVVGGGKSAVLQDVAPEQLTDPLPATRPVGRADVEAVRLPVTVRGYRMTDVDEVLGRLGAELAERDARIAELESALAGAQATAVGGPDLLKRPEDRPQPTTERPEERPQPTTEHPEDRPKAPWEAPGQDPRQDPRHDPRQGPWQDTRPDPWQAPGQQTRRPGEEPRR
ncbi:DivIVA domain-containing protein [Streptomyces sp. NPDC057543]|uniref:DivIVA domain-containing protein n=1 Tax=Streptomyces sp. NPDC057543 TaxID=3346163 RepID=UPI0036B2E160